MTVQDDVRERELCRTLGLLWDQAHARGGEDAVLKLTVAGVEYRLSVEVKSTTRKTVSTARDVSMGHITRWRSKLFVIGFYDHKDKRPELQRLLCLTPDDMAPWIDGVAAKIEPDFKIALRASRHLDMMDLHDVCGQKTAYTLDDAKRLHKAQWTAAQYLAAADVEAEGGAMLSPEAMLNLLQLRALYIAQRGATLNNPHITSEHLKRFWGTDRETPPADAAAAIRKLAADFITTHPGHAAFA
ncbi:MAG: hypothetical protein HC793_03085 [Aquincola sp.]|nr:hypothetical protein [Aquincola sp.]